MNDLLRSSLKERLLVFQRPVFGGDRPFMARRETHEMRMMGIITVNNSDMTANDWIEHHRGMQKFTAAFTKGEQFAALNDQQAIITFEIDEADLPQMEEHVRRPESIAFDTKAQITVQSFICELLD